MHVKEYLKGTKKFQNRKHKILMLTHMNADNVGDQTIEVCSNALVRAALENLGIKSDEYHLISEDANIVNHQTLSAQYNQQAKVAEELIKEADLIIFGGSPIFNFAYESFAERTAKTLRIIQKYNKTVLIAGIGVENFDPANDKCMELKKEILNSDVRMITTRDNIEALCKFTQGSSVVTAKVSDPAVFTSSVFSQYRSQKSTDRKKIGIFVIRGTAFVDNKIDFTKEQTVALWKDLTEELEKRGYDYELITSGSNSDEAFLHNLIINHGFDSSKCVTNMSIPEDLSAKISSYDGVVTCRLHPSIISYSFGVPSIGIVWNGKVASFYDSIGYPERVMTVDGISADKIVDRLEKALREGVYHDKDFLLSTYTYLFEGIKAVFCPENNVSMFSCDELTKNLPRYTASDFSEKIDWKLSRIYNAYNKNQEKSKKTAGTIKQYKNDYNAIVEKYNNLEMLLRENYNDGLIADYLKASDKEKQSQRIKIYYNIGKLGEKSLKDNISARYSASMGTIAVRPNSLELIPVNQSVMNNGSMELSENVFRIEGYKFLGWRIRVGVGESRYLWLENGKFANKKEYKESVNGPCRIFMPGELLPVIPLDSISNCVAEGVWRKE